jgi:predicted anti-sigma-YlaC factor YlaD
MSASIAPSALRRGALVGLLAVSTILPTACVKKIAMNSLADALSSSTSGSFSQDEDLGLVGDAIPFALKTMESLHGEVPDHRGLELALVSGFTQYGMVWVQWPAEQQKYSDFEVYRAGLERARKLFLRARGYGLEGMEAPYPGFSERIFTDTDAALQPTTTDDIPMMYWLGASWLAAISNSREHPELIGQLPIAAALLHRCLELDPDWDRGAIHELLISLEPSLPVPGGADRSRGHFERAMELNGGVKAGPYVSLATAITIDTQDREAFEGLLEQALAVDLEASPQDRLANEYAQQQARFLLDHVDDLFI